MTDQPKLIFAVLTRKTITVMRIKIFPKPELSLHFCVEEYAPYENQDLPRPQTDCKYLLLTNKKWVMLYYVGGVFFLPSQKLFTDYFKWEIWQDENTILKGVVLQDIDNRFLSKEGWRLKIAYQFWEQNRSATFYLKKLFKLKK